MAVVLERLAVAVVGAEAAAGEGAVRGERQQVVQIVLRVPSRIMIIRPFRSLPWASSSSVDSWSEWIPAAR